MMTKAYQRRMKLRIMGTAMAAEVSRVFAKLLLKKCKKRAQFVTTDFHVA
jgi:hypothetical protein